MLLGHLYNTFKKGDGHTDVNIMADVYFRRRLKIYRFRVKTMYEITELTPEATTKVLDDFKTTCKDISENFNVHTDTRLDIETYGVGKMIVAERVRLKGLLKILK